jgi:hypothetical protein
MKSADIFTTAVSGVAIPSWRRIDRGEPFVYHDPRMLRIVRKFDHVPTPVSSLYEVCLCSASHFLNQAMSFELG